MAMQTVIELPEPAATAAFGRRLAGLLFPGAVVALIGPLGAGKTHLVRAVAEGLGCDGRRVSSPTFALIHEYPGGRLPVYHFDTYRLPDEAAFADLSVAGGSPTVSTAALWASSLPSATARNSAHGMSTPGRRRRSPSARRYNPGSATTTVTHCLQTSGPTLTVWRVKCFPAGSLPAAYISASRPHSRLHRRRTSNSTTTAATTTATPMPV